MLHQPLHILVIEDNIGDYVLVKEYLEESFQNASFYHADTLGKGLFYLEEIAVHVVLLDLTLPDGNGITLFQTVYAKAPNIPIIILTGLGNTQLALETLKIGAQDYIVKDDANATVLLKSIQYGIERTKTLEQIRRSEEQYKYLFYNNPLPMVAFDNKYHRFFMVNEAALNHYGYSEQEFLQMTVEDLFAREEYDNGIYTLTLANNIKQSYTVDLRHRKKSGEVIEVEMGTHDIVIEGRNASLAVIHDVTDRNKAKRMLHESEQMFRTISENFPNGAVAILNKDFIIEHIAGNDFPVKDVDAGFFRNTNYTTYFQSPVKEQVSGNLATVFSGHSTVFETTLEDGSYMVSAVPLHESNGNINKILLASQNITAQKKAENEKELLIEELIQNNTDLRQFSYITSHNLRAPLSNLLGIIKLLDLSSVSDPMTKLLLKNFEECTLQLNDTVNDLINVLIIKNSVNAKKETIDLRRSFERVVQSIHNEIDQCGMTIECFFDDAFEVQFNKSYLESILLNLVTNSVKYRSPNRKPRVEVRTEPFREGVRLYFSDNGLGIDLERNRSRIFGLYQRFHEHADSKGLGLYIVNSQVRVMGGEIDVKSEVDKGTTFIITFKN